MFARLMSLPVYKLEKVVVYNLKSGKRRVESFNSRDLYVNNKNIPTKITKNNCRQNNICHNDAPSKDLTIKPPKLKQNAPKKTNKGPGNFAIKFI